MNKKTIIIGIGASAGGLEALKDFISSIKPSGKFCYVVAQHLSPSHKSMLVTLLAKNSNIEVKELSDGDEIVTDIIYITPPNYNVHCLENSFKLTAPDNFVGPKPSIDILFKSIADLHTQHCCGIILSGTGSDGAVGVRAIKAAGGITIAQEPQKAKYDGMPRSAIETGDVDIISPAESIYSELEDIFINNKPIHIEEISEQPPGNYKKIVNIIKKNYKIDLDGYKENTIDRRIRRRMAALRIDTYSNYVKCLQKNQKEISNLFKDLLISVTSFFRDNDAYEKLTEVLEDKYRDSEAEVFRVWVAACATGEEAYSIAIILNELFENRHGNIDIQIFATDIDESALAIARKGVYSEASLSDMPQHMIEKYFRRAGSNFEVVKSLREHVIFSRHDITQDPPFLRIDLISCRNLMIYFKPILQKEVLSKFYYSLNPRGVLFLGKSETVGDLSPIIKAIDSKLRIYEVSEADSKFRRIHINNYSHVHKKDEVETSANKFNIDQYLSELTLYQLFDRFIIIDDNSSFAP
ncbi:MAG: chemotaxis protein CheB [Deferribacterales bacterium]